MHACRRPLGVGLLICLVSLKARVCDLIHSDCRFCSFGSLLTEHALTRSGGAFKLALLMSAADPVHADLKRPTAPFVAHISCLKPSLPKLPVRHCCSPLLLEFYSCCWLCSWCLLHLLQFLLICDSLQHQAVSDSFTLHSNFVRPAVQHSEQSWVKLMRVCVAPSCIAT